MSANSTNHHSSGDNDSKIGSNDKFGMRSGGSSAQVPLSGSSSVFHDMFSFSTANPTESDVDRMIPRSKQSVASSPKEREATQFSTPTTKLRRPDLCSDEGYHPFKTNFGDAAFHTIDSARPEPLWNDAKPASLTPGPKFHDSSLAQPESKSTLFATTLQRTAAPSLLEDTSSPWSYRSNRGTGRTPGPEHSKSPEYSDMLSPDIRRHEESISRLVLSETPQVKDPSHGSGTFHRATSLAMTPNALFGLSSAGSGHSVSADLIHPTSDLSYDAEPFDYSAYHRRFDEHRLPSSQNQAHLSQDVPGSKSLADRFVMMDQSAGRLSGRDDSPFTEHRSQRNSKPGRQFTPTSSFEGTLLPPPSLSAEPVLPQRGHGSFERSSFEAREPYVAGSSRFRNSNGSSVNSLPRRLQNSRDNALTSSGGLPEDSQRLTSSLSGLNQSGQPVADLRVSTDSLKSAMSKVSVPRIPISVPHGTQDFVESPTTKSHYKNFQLFLKSHMKNGAFNKEEVLSKIEAIPEHSRWRCYIELAEIAKKNNEYDQAREFYILACCSERRATSSWLEWSKMEEENGYPDKALKILNLSIIICKLNESLLPRIIKLRERQHQYDRIRGVLSALKYEALEKSWKSILEGSLFEARIGNFKTTRDNLKFLMRYVPWYGPLYLEAYRLEEREERDEDALKIIAKGLVELPRYGPLWFGMIHIKERRDILEERRMWQRGVLPPLQQSTQDCNAAVIYISRELMWRVYLERFFIEERACEIAARGLANKVVTKTIEQCRREVASLGHRSLVQSLLLCAGNLRWKVLLIGARMELHMGNVAAARTLLAQAYEEIPKKSLSSVIIECSRLEEYIGHVSVARKILRKACHEMSGDWRLFYEWILLEARQGQLMPALEVARVAALRHPSTGRIWALLAQLYHRWEALRPYLGSRIADEIYVTFPRSSQSIDLQMHFSPREVVVRNALAEVPKSGEVWCEEGRARINPLLSQQFDLTLAQQSFAFAMQFTPQFGDTLIEYLRLEFLARSCLRAVCRVLEIDFDLFVSNFLCFDMESDLLFDVKQARPSPASSQESTHLRKISTASSRDKRRDIQRIVQLDYSIEEDIRRLEDASFPQLHRRCLNADPNYGLIWIHCRELPDDIPARILARARRILLQDLLGAYPLYLRATLYYVDRVLTQELDAYQMAEMSGVNSLPYKQYHGAVHKMISNSEEFARLQIILDDIRVMREEDPDFSRCADGDHTYDTEFTAPPLIFRLPTGHSYCLSDFSTGCVEINRAVFNRNRDKEESWHYLFATDCIV